jgi:hypothetical protein
MRLPKWVVCLSGLALAALLAEEIRAESKAVKFTKEWKGSVADASLQKGAPEVITDATALEKLWKAWMVPDKLPQVDFTKEIVVLATTSGTRINVSAKLDDKGNLQVLGVATSDIAPGFRYVLATVPREGIKKLNGKDLPKE